MLSFGGLCPVLTVWNKYFLGRLFVLSVTVQSWRLFSEQWTVGTARLRRSQPWPPEHTIRRQNQHHGVASDQAGLAHPTLIHHKLHMDISAKKIQIFISIRQCRSFPMERWRFVTTCTADTALALNSFLFPECRLHPADTRLAKLVKLWWSKKVNHFNWLNPITLQTDLRPLFKNNLCRKHLVWDSLSTSNYAFRKSVPRLQSHQIPIYL